MPIPKRLQYPPVMSKSINKDEVSKVQIRSTIKKSSNYLIFALTTIKSNIFRMKTVMIISRWTALTVS